ncbi:PAS domain-containing protein [Erythrobacter gaetbuli]|uniref:histidine kinase n=1 Tax=Qipengyuania gaetbuli TaxID=266952 RepID=A0A844XYY4_9SPHN|nr:PAS domain-containing protein [Qipengyuania gaetbuli]MXO50874.1 PAS domain-containing protein [Qipengyuania gaetbuli]
MASSVVSASKNKAARSTSPPPLSDFGALQLAGDAFHALADTMPQIVWSTLPDGSHDYYNARWYEFTGVPIGSTDGEGWAALFHPEDQPNAWAKWRHSLETGEPYEVEYRLRHHSGEYRWMIGRASPIYNGQGTIQRWIGTCTDVDDQKAIALQNEILSQELSHRIKNIFAIISGLVSLSARAEPALSSLAKELLGRISALGRAHEFVRPHTEKSRPIVGDGHFSALLEQIFIAYHAYSEGRITVSGSEIPVDSKAATPVALVFHELATNAIKYGSLSSDKGTVSIKVNQSDEFAQIIWREEGDSCREPQAMAAGFGTRLIDMAVRQQLGGDYTRRWSDKGLRMEVKIPLKRLRAS